MRAGALHVLAPLAFVGFAACEDEPKPPKTSGEIYVTPGSSSTGGASSLPPSEQYAYLAKRRVSAVGLAEARHIETPDARAVVDHLADALDACVTQLEQQGTLAPGAARLIAQFAPDGGVAAAVLVKVEPASGPVVATAKLCFEARIKLLTISLGDAGGRGMAVEALWGAPPGTASP